MNSLKMTQYFLLGGIVSVACADCYFTNSLVSACEASGCNEKVVNACSGPTGEGSQNKDMYTTYSGPSGPGGLSSVSDMYTDSCNITWKTKNTLGQCVVNHSCGPFNFDNRSIATGGLCPQGIE